MRILIADDDPVSLLYLQDALEEWGYEVSTAADGNSALAQLRRPEAPTLAILDWMMPGLDGIDVCRAVRAGAAAVGGAAARYTYIIMLTSRTETQFVVQGLDAGADDFVSKPFNPEELHVRLRTGRRICALQEELRIKATHDALTGLYNRGAVLEALERDLARHERDGAQVSILFADLDHFKQTNDQYGHLAGDEVLREVSRRISGALRPYDMIGRYGGEELMIVLPGCDRRCAMDVAERVRACVAAAPVATDAGAIQATLSIGGCTLAPDDRAPLDQFIQLADEALYAAKRSGRNRVEWMAWRDSGPAP